MNKQELIKSYENARFGIVSVNGVLEDLRQLDESQKVTVPQFVADVIEGAREKSPELEDALHYTWDNGSKEFTEWYKKKSNRDRFDRAFLDGYTVEKEKRYLVKVKGVYFNNALIFDKINKVWFFSSIYETDHQIGHHTRKQLEDAGFGWVFDCSGIEIEEVQDDSKI